MIYTAGFPAIYVTGFGVTASYLGRPDIGFITLSEITSVLRQMTSVVTVPVVADAKPALATP